jgi:D-alanyl-D-alanine dipeptidase
MNNITYITDPKVLAIPIIECHEPLVDIKYSKDLLYGPIPECELTADCFTKIRKSVYEKLCRAQQDLPSGWRFRLYEGFRSLKVQQILFEQEYQRVIARYPHESEQKKFYETTHLVSPVINFDGSYNVPPHNTGAAIDIEMIDENNELIDMGMEAKDWGQVTPELCLTACKTINKKAQQNRQLLLDVLQAQDFVNYPTEWWHFSYGDRYWAYHKNKQHAIYGSAELATGINL